MEFENVSANPNILRVISLRSEKLANETFEVTLRAEGHKVTVLTSTEPAFALVNSNWPDVVLVDPISQFGMSGSIQRLCSGFDGPIVATGHIPDPTITSMLEELGVHKFAATISELLAILKHVPTRTVHSDDESMQSFATGSAQILALRTEAKEQKIASPVNRFPSIQNTEPSQLPLAETSTPPVANESVPAKRRRSLSLPNLKSFSFTLPMKRWHRTAVGVAAATAVIVAVTLPFIGASPAEQQQQDGSVAKALPVIPNLLTNPVAPLTLEELSGELLPLEIAGIKDRAVIEKAAVAFWGDTAPDAFVTVNGDPVDVSKYGAFVVDYPLEDGANFIEVLASDFQGRTTRQSFTVVSLQ